MKFVWIFFFLLNSIASTEGAEGGPDQLRNCLQSWLASTASSRYQITQWTIPTTQPQRAFEFKLPVNDLDKQLWRETRKNKKKEVGVFEIFDSSGPIYRSDVIQGDAHQIDGTVSIATWKKVTSIAEENSDRVLAIRFTHTHPHHGVFIEGRNIGIATGNRLSPTDIKAGLSFRTALDSNKKLSHIHFEIIAVSFHSPTIEDVLNEESRLMRRIGKMLKGAVMRQWFKSSVVIVGTK